MTPKEWKKMEKSKRQGRLQGNEGWAWQFPTAFARSCPELHHTVLLAISISSYPSFDALFLPCLLCLIWDLSSVTSDSWEITNFAISELLNRKLSSAYPPSSQPYLVISHGSLESDATGRPGHGYGRWSSWWRKSALCVTLYA